MAIKLEDKPNVQPPDGSYNYGKVKDNDGSNNGTPVNTLVYSDLHLFFEKLMEAGGVVHNGLYDSDDDGYQLYQAFQKAARRELKTLLGILAETMIGDDTSPISAISPYSLLGIKWNIGLTILSAGYIYYNEELFFCGGFTGAIADTAVFTKTADNVLQVTDAVSGSGDFDYSELVFVQSPTKVKTKVIDIGTWDMDADTQITVAHGIADHTKIRSVSVMVRNDADTGYYNLIEYTAAATGMSAIWVNSTTVVLNRAVGGIFDGVDFDGTPYNRGWITIQYID